MPARLLSVDIASIGLRVLSSLTFIPQGLPNVLKCGVPGGIADMQGYMEILQIAISPLCMPRCLGSVHDLLNVEHSAQSELLDGIWWAREVLQGDQEKGSHMRRGPRASEKGLSTLNEEKCAVIAEMNPAGILHENDRLRTVPPNRLLFSGPTLDSVSGNIASEQRPYSR